MRHERVLVAERRAPARLAQGVDGDDAPGVAREHAQYLVLLGGEQHRLSIGALHLGRGEVHAAGVQLERRALFGVAAPQHRGDAQHELLGEEWLGEVVVGAQGQAAHAVEGLVLRRKEHRGHAGARGPLAHAGEQVEAVHAGHHHVEHEQLVGALGRGRAAVDGGERLGPCMHDVHTGEPRAVQDGRHHVGQLALVVHHQDALAAQMLVHHTESARCHLASLLSRSHYGTSAPRPGGRARGVRQAQGCVRETQGRGRGSVRPPA